MKLIFEIKLTSSLKIINMIKGAQLNGNLYRV